MISTNPPSLAFGLLDGALIGVEMGGHLSLCPGGERGHNFMVLLQEGESSQVKEIQVLQVNTSIHST